MMKLKLRTKLSMSYLLIGLLCILIITVFSNVFLEKSFINYVIKNQTMKNESIVEQLQSQIDNEGAFDTNAIETIGITALEQGMIMRVEKLDGRTIWDAKVHNNGLCEEMIAHMSMSMMEKVPNWQGEVIEAEYSLVQNGQDMGKVTIEFYGPYYFTDSDVAFVETLNLLLLVVSGIAIVMALTVGTIMARRTSKPLSIVMETAHEITNGNYEARSMSQSSTVEIDALTDSINGLAETLENQEKLRQRLTRDVAHELRTPLATLQSHMEAMIDGIWIADANRLKSCHEEIVRITELVGDLEKLARAENEAFKGERNPVALKQLIENQIKNFESDYYKKYIQIEFECLSEETIMGDKNQLNQVIVNLMSNALKYSPEYSKLIISLSATSTESIIAFQDFGYGIAETDLPFIFERFYRADQSRNRTTGGAGIGLTISQAIVKGHGGKITVSSTIGKGSTFKIVLPKTPVI